MYLVIQNDTKSKSYQTTNDCARPYLKLKDGAQIPLTTNTTNGFYINVKSSSSHSESASYLTSDTESSGMSSVTALTSEVVDTYYSSAGNSEGMSSITALTSQGTKTYYSSNANGAGLSSTTALTRASTSGTVYQTGTQNQSAYIWYSGQGGPSGGGAETLAFFNAKIATKSNGATYNRNFSWTLSPKSGNTMTVTDSYAAGGHGGTGTFTANVWSTNAAGATSTNATLTGGGGQYNAFSMYYTPSAKAYVTTGTSYQTRSSTSGYSGVSSSTSEATTGYSGVSSSSSESTSGYTGYSSSETTITNSALMRPKEYNSASASESYYTSALSPDGMSSTTALTRESTSGYLTRSSTSGYETKGIGNSSVLYTSQYFNQARNSITLSCITSTKYQGYNEEYQYLYIYGNPLRISSQGTNFNTTYTSESTITSGFGIGAVKEYISNDNIITTSFTYKQGVTFTETWSKLVDVQTTATLTCSSTYSTLTCESTSGYSGVSSSSSSSADWEED